MLIQAIHRTHGVLSRNHNHKYGASKGLGLTHDSMNITSLADDIKNNQISH